MNDCETVAPINVWAQTGAYVLVGLAEIFSSITGLEYAYTKAPANMKSLVFGKLLPNHDVVKNSVLTHLTRLLQLH